MPFDPVPHQHLADLRKKRLFLPAEAKAIERRQAPVTLVEVTLPDDGISLDSQRLIATAADAANELSLGGQQVAIVVTGVAEGENSVVRAMRPAPRAMQQLRELTSSPAISVLDHKAVGINHGRAKSTQYLVNRVAAFYHAHDDIKEVVAIRPAVEALRGMTEYENAKVLAQTPWPFDATHTVDQPSIAREGLIYLPVAAAAPFKEFRALNAPTAEAWSLVSDYERNLPLARNYTLYRGSDVVIPIASQHPLFKGLHPGYEFEMRIFEAVRIAMHLPQDTRVTFLFVGDVHDKVGDLVSLAQAGFDHLPKVAKLLGYKRPLDRLMFTNKIANGDLEHIAVTDYVLRERPNVGRVIWSASHGHGPRKFAMAEALALNNNLMMQAVGTPGAGLLVEVAAPLMDPIFRHHGAHWEAGRGLTEVLWFARQPELMTNKSSVYQQRIVGGSIDHAVADRPGALTESIFGAGEGHAPPPPTWLQEASLASQSRQLTAVGL